MARKSIKGLEDHIGRLEAMIKRLEKFNLDLDDEVSEQKQTIITLKQQLAETKLDLMELNSINKDHRELLLFAIILQIERDLKK